MNLSDTENLLCLMRKHGVSYFKSVEYEIRIDQALPLAKLPDQSADQNASGPVAHNNSHSVTSASAPPVEMTIPHHVNEVKNLLKLSDEQLVDKLFPDYTEQVNAND